ncbi:MAG: N-acetyl sugar amidotransferase [Candidatus Altiarchaeales archaeon HGW-Altiarchaeales-1]|nr:MAG: N-acetyl sugar amidotransferase [Candidatus Altiarchaeales archaeon HGW-Altiarchaeales-1]
MSNQKVCTRCVMDTSDPDIQFDEDGVCNHCRKYEKIMHCRVYSDEEKQQKLKHLANKIKEEGKNKEYDCIIGVSGGVDSTMVAYTVKKKLGLRPLAIHLDNGWDSELSIKNIEKICKVLDIDLFTHVLDWEEFKNIQLSFLKSSFINAEMPTDHAIMAVLFQVADEKRIPYIINGSNFTTEGILPNSWVYDVRDWKFIEGIHRKFGKLKLKTFPHYGLIDMFYYLFIKSTKFVTILDYIDYNKKDAMKLIEKELGWKYYSGKHYESIFTRFYQGYILPKKFKIDKRIAHLSTLICSGQITREEALEELKKDPYPSEEMMKEDKEYVIKKLGLTEEEFEKIMSLPIKTFESYPNNSFLFNKLKLPLRIAYKFGLVPPIVYFRYCV